MSTLVRANIKSYDVSTHSATVQIIGSLAVWLDGVPVSVGIAPADVVAGRECGVIFFTDDNPADASVVTIHNVVPTGWSGTPPHRVRDADNNTYVEVENTANEDKVRMGVGGTLRYLLQTASPHHQLTGDMTVSGNIGVSGSSADSVTGVNFSLTTAASGWIGGSFILNCSGAGAVARGVAGGVAYTGASGASSYVRGLDYFVQHDGAGTVSDLFGAYVQLYGAGPATNRVVVMAEYGASGAASSTINAGVRSFFNVAGGGGSTLTKYHAFLSDFSVSRTTVTNFYHFAVNTLSYVFSGGPATMHFFSAPASSSTKPTTVYGLELGSQSGAGVVWVPIDVDGPARTTDTDGSVHRPNIQIGSRTRKFGGGDGVIGLTYATTNPGSNPAGGVIIYADGATGDVKIRGAAGAIVKLPSGGATNVTGSRGGNAALANLLTVLNGLGLIVDGTTA